MLAGSPKFDSSATLAVLEILEHQDFRPLPLSVYFFRRIWICLGFALSVISLHFDILGFALNSLCFTSMISY